MNNKIENNAIEESYHLAYRKRLRQRFFKCGPEALLDYELLELILCIALPNSDVKLIANDLITKFGSLADVISADLERLKEVCGVEEMVATSLKIIQAAAIALLRENILSTPVIGSWTALTNYCRACMAYQKTEQFRILFLDRKNMLIADELQQRGTIDHTPVYPREVIKRGLELGTSALILVHNHPSGDPTPSRQDIAMTREIINAGKNLGITVHDHIVVGKKGTASFKTLGLI